MRSVLAVVCSMAFAMTLCAADEHGIDAKLAVCMEKDPSTAGMLECLEGASVAWDRELNEAYTSLMKRLAAPQQEALRKAQRQWVAWRDAEFAMLDALYGGLEGTMFLPMRADDRMQIVKARALALRSLESLLKIDE